MGDLSTMATGFAPMLTAGFVLVDFAVYSTWMSGMVGPEFLVFAAMLIFLMTSLVTAANVAVKTVDASVSFVDGFAYIYRNSSTLGNLLGAWELFFVMAFLVWSLGVTYMSFEVVSGLADILNARELAAYTDGQFGVTLDMFQAIKAIIILMLMATTTWVAGCALSDNADELLDWFNHYQDDTKTEADTKVNSIVDEDGTAITYDLVYHSTTLVYAYTVFTTIIFGSYYFMHHYGQFKPVQNCDLENIDSAPFAGLVDEFKGLSQTTYDQCLDIFKRAGVAMDTNKDGLVDRCEDARFLKAIGNTDEYALNYSGSFNTAGAQQWCKVLVIDAFDTLKDEEENDLLQTIIGWAGGFWPLNIFAGKDDKLINFNIGEDKDSKMDGGDADADNTQ